MTSQYYIGKAIKGPGKYFIEDLNQVTEVKFFRSVTKAVGEIIFAESIKETTIKQVTDFLLEGKTVTVAGNYFFIKSKTTT